MTTMNFGLVLSKTTPLKCLNRFAQLVKDGDGWMDHLITGRTGIPVNQQEEMEQRE